MKEETVSHVLLNCLMEVKYKNVQCGRIFFVQRTLSFEGVIIRHECGLITLNEFGGIHSSLHPLKFIKQGALVKKELIEQYKTLYYGHEDYYDVIHKNVIGDFEEIEGQEVVPIIIDHSAGELRTIDNEPLEHMVRYNGHCYMVTDRDYRMKELMAFLKERDDVIIHDEGKIPYYNLDEGESNVAYANFFVRVPTDKFKFINKKSLFNCLPKEIIDIEQFNRRKRAKR